ncbi:hypothetical protein OSG_eHP31_00130 [environmental Halophage eHP-31]|nr:hypothetical protein OSG_eHP31_00130 [environmental Halophage eHP-31]
MAFGRSTAPHSATIAASAIPTGSESGVVSMSESQPYQVMPDLDGEEYDRLKEDIRENGIEYPIIVDGDGDIIDGHHRYQAWTDLGRDPDDIPTRVVDDDDSDNYHRAYRTNLLRRDLTDGTKRQVVKQYLLEHPERVAEDTQAEIASDLGVSRKTVGRAIEELPEDVKCGQVTELSTDEKRQQVRAYVEDHPDASNREVAREVDCDVSHVTVGNWRDEWDIQEPTTGLDTFTNSKSEADEALDVIDAATDDDADGEVRETAQQKAQEITDGQTTPGEAHDDVEQAEREHEEQQQQQERDQQRRESYENSDETVEVRHGDFRNVLDAVDNNSVDHVVTDPPYDEDALELWAALGAHAARVLKPGGFLIAYSGKAHLPAVHDALRSHLDYHWQAVVNHAGPGAKIFSRKLRTGYKPILIYTNGDPDLQDDFVTDVIGGGGREKDDHDWQQAEAEAAKLIESFTEVDDRICDPMCGSGTIGVAAHRLNRRCLLVDEDGDAVETAREKVVL